jgi:hypothetical protein
VGNDFYVNYDFVVKIDFSNLAENFLMCDFIDWTILHRGLSTGYCQDLSTLTGWTYQALMVISKIFDPLCLLQLHHIRVMNFCSVNSYFDLQNVNPHLLVKSRYNYSVTLGSCYLETLIVCSNCLDHSLASQGLPAEVRLLFHFEPITDYHLWKKIKMFGFSSSC